MDGACQRAVDLYFRIRHHAIEDNAHLTVIPLGGHLEGSAINAVFIAGHSTFLQIIAPESIVAVTLQFPA